MNLLLDTHAFIWWLIDDPEIRNTRAMDLIADPGNTVFVSAASSYEIVLQNRQGRWPAVDLIAMNVAAVIRGEGFQELPPDHRTYAACSLFVSGSQGSV